MCVCWSGWLAGTNKLLPSATAYTNSTRPFPDLWNRKPQKEGFFTRLKKSKTASLDKTHSCCNNTHAGKIITFLLHSKHLAFLLQLIFLMDSSTSINLAEGAFFANSNSRFQTKPFLNKIFSQLLSCDYQLHLSSAYCIKSLHTNSVPCEIHLNQQLYPRFLTQKYIVSSVRYIYLTTGQTGPDLSIHLYNEIHHCLVILRTYCW